LADSSAATSQNAAEYSSVNVPSETDIWTEALKLSPQKFYTWEMKGRFVPLKKLLIHVNVLIWLYGLHEPKFVGGFIHM